MRFCPVKLLNCSLIVSIINNSIQVHNRQKKLLKIQISKLLENFGENAEVQIFKGEVIHHGIAQNSLRKLQKWMFICCS